MSEETKNLSVSVERDGAGQWSIVVRIDGEDDRVYPVESQEQGQEKIKSCLPFVMPILIAVAQRGEYVSFTINKDVKGTMSDKCIHCSHSKADHTRTSLDMGEQMFYDLCKMCNCWGFEASHDLPQDEQEYYA